MYGNRSASGLAGSDATTANSLPATSSTATTRAPNQARPPFPPGTVAATAAAIQNHRDDPHLAGNEACLCPSCHLKDNFFPRSQDGRIVLPHPSLSIHSTRLPGSTTTTSMNAASLTTPGLVTTRKRSRADSTASNSDLRLSIAKFNQGRRGGGGGLRTRHLQNDKGEGSSTGAGRISANVEENWMTLSHSSNREVIPTDESQRTRRSRPGGRHSFSGLPRRSRLSAKHDQPGMERPDPWPRILESEEFSGQPSPLTQPSSRSQQSHPLNTKSRLEVLLDKLGTYTVPQNPLQGFRARESSSQMARLASVPSAAPLTASQSHIGTFGHDHYPISSSLRDQSDPSILSYPEPPGRLDTSYHHHHHHHHDSASRLENPTDAVHTTQDKPKIIRFSSRSENPQPSNNPDAIITTPGEENVHSSPITTDPPPLSSSSSSSHQLQPPFEGSSSSSNAQTQFRFQEPVVPEQSPNSSPVRSRDLSNVQVKWDSERKRRQGYFAQEEGSEKSPFRHYNKANCDFES